jgi:uncharacterized membrane protein YhaH (DUF805 family)
MAHPDELRKSVERARRRVYWGFALALVAAVMSGAVGEAFPNTVQSDVTDVVLITFIGVFVLFAIRLNNAVREWKRRSKVYPPNKAV